jgi:hypothetical protein
MQEDDGISATKKDIQRDGLDIQLSCTVTGRGRVAKRSKDMLEKNDWVKVGKVRENKAENRGTEGEGVREKSKGEKRRERKERGKKGWVGKKDKRWERRRGEKGR